MKAIIAGAIFLCLAWWTGPALLAQQPDDPAGWPAVEEETDWRFSLGLGVMAAPEFEGSGDYKAVPVPVIDLRYSRFFLSTAQGLGAELYADDHWSLAPSLRWRFGRDQDDSDLLRGLGDVDGGLELGGFVRWNDGGFRSEPDRRDAVGPRMELSAGLDFHHGLGLARGWTTEASAAVSVGVPQAFVARLGLAAMYADGAYNQAYFGVTPLQGALSGYRVYEADGGIKHWATNLSFTYFLRDDLSITPFGEYRRLTGPAADSPLVEAGSTDQFMGGLTMVYHWGR